MVSRTKRQPSGCCSAAVCVRVRSTYSGQAFKKTLPRSNTRAVNFGRFGLYCDAPHISKCARALTFVRNFDHIWELFDSTLNKVNSRVSTFGTFSWLSKSVNSFTFKLLERFFSHLDVSKSSRLTQSSGIKPPSVSCDFSFSCVSHQQTICHTCRTRSTSPTHVLTS